MNLFKSLSVATQSLALNQSKAITPAVNRSVAASSDATRYQFQYMNGQVVLYDNQTGGLVTQGYLNNSDLFSVIRYVVRKAMRTNFFLYEVKDSKSFGQFITLKGEHATEHSLLKAEAMKRKALEETAMPAIDKLLAQPNPYQDFRSFVEASVSYRLLTGERFIQVVDGLYPVSAMYILPPTLIEVLSGGSYMQIGGYRYTPTRTLIPVEEVIYSRDFMPSLQGNGDELRGLSPLRVLALSLQKSNEGKLSALKQYQNSGPPGVLSIVAQGSQEPIDQAQAEQMEASIMRRSGGSSNRGRVHVSSMKAEYTQLGLSPVDLDILESGLFDLRDFCRAYGIDSKVVGDPSSSTFNNMAEAGKAAIVDAVIPAVLSLADDLNSVIKPFNVNGKQYYIDADVSHFPELAEDLNALADRLNKIPLTLNEKREAMQYERNDAPGMDEVWVGNDKTPLSQFMEPPATGGAEGSNDGTY